MASGGWESNFAVHFQIYFINSYLPEIELSAIKFWRWVDIGCGNDLPLGNKPLRNAYPDPYCQMASLSHKQPHANNKQSKSHSPFYSSENENQFTLKSDENYKIIKHLTDMNGLHMMPLNILDKRGLVFPGHLQMQYWYWTGRINYPPSMNITINTVSFESMNNATCSCIIHIFSKQYSTERFHQVVKLSLFLIPCTQSLFDALHTDLQQHNSHIVITLRSWWLLRPGYCHHLIWATLISQLTTRGQDCLTPNSLNIFVCQ